MSRPKVRPNGDITLREMREHCRKMRGCFECDYYHTYEEVPGFIEDACCIDGIPFSWELEEPKEEGDMKEYHKIETVYERDTKGTKKLMEGKFRDHAVEYLKDNTWLFTEKIDGTNIRILWDGHNISFAGRTDKSAIPLHLMDYLTKTFSTNEMEEMFEQLFGEKEVILFGEGYGPKIQKVGELYRNDCSFILCDIQIYDLYLEYTNVINIATALGIDVVPIVLVGTISQAVEFVKQHPMSTIGSAPMEGLVGRPKIELYDRFGKRLIVKIKACDF